MGKTARCVRWLIVLAGAGLVAPHVTGARMRDRDTVEQNNGETPEKQQKLIEKIQRLEAERRRLQQLRLMQIERDRRNKNKKTVDANEVWHHCSVAIRQIDGQLDKGYVERQLQSYLSGFAAIIKKENKTGRYEFRGTVDAEGKMTALDVVHDSFRSSTLRDRIGGIISRLNYGRSSDGNGAVITLVIMRELE